MNALYSQDFLKNVIRSVEALRAVGKSRNERVYDVLPGRRGYFGAKAGEVKLFRGKEKVCRYMPKV